MIGPGTYKFRVRAYAEVFGGLIQPLNGDAEVTSILQGYATSADFSGVSLTLRATDQPIPEPVTTTLAGLGLGALVLYTTRRRRA